MRSTTTLTSLLAATFLTTTALASSAGAQSMTESRFELRPFVGAFLPTGDQRDLLDDGVSVGAQGAYALTNNLSLVGTLAWSKSADKSLAYDDKVDVLHYDLGAEYRQPFAVGAGTTLSPFVGLGLGGRTYDYRDRVSNAETNFVGYGAMGGQLDFGRVGVRLEARDYASGFKGLTGELDERKTRHDVTIISAFTLSY